LINEAECANDWACFSPSAWLTAIKGTVAFTLAGGGDFGKFFYIVGAGGGIPVAAVFTAPILAKYPNDFMVPTFSAEGLGDAYSVDRISTISTHGGILSEAKGRRVLSDLKAAFPVK
jgi:hypothetical protein